MTAKFIPKLDPELLASNDPCDLDVTNPDNWSDETWEEAQAIPKDFDWTHGVVYAGDSDWADDPEENKALDAWWETEGSSLHLNLYESHWMPPDAITLTPLQLRCLLDSHAIMIRDIDAEDRLRAHEANMALDAIEEFDTSCPSCDTKTANNA